MSGNWYLLSKHQGLEISEISRGNIDSISERFSILTSLTFHFVSVTVSVSISMYKLVDGVKVSCLSSEDYIEMIENGNISTVQSLLTNPRRVIKYVADDFDEITKFQGVVTAIKHGNLDMIKMMIDTDPDTYLRMINKTLLISHAVEYSQPEIVRFMIGLLPNLKKFAERYYWIVGEAVLNDDLDMIHTLLDCGWNLLSDYEDIADMVIKFGTERSSRALESINPAEISDSGKILMYSRIFERASSSKIINILIWFRDHGFPLPNEIWDIYIYMVTTEDMYLSDDIEILQILFSKTTGTRWCKQDFGNIDLLPLARHVNQEQYQDQGTIIRRIIELFIRNVSCKSEQDCIDRLVTAFPEYEALERSLPL